jgi:hypothetical protein
MVAITGCVGWAKSVESALSTAPEQAETIKLRIKIEREQYFKFYR